MAVLTFVYALTAGRCRLSEGSTCPPQSTLDQHLHDVQLRHSTRRDGPVSSSTGKTTKGVVTSAITNVPQKPIRRLMPQKPVRIQNTTYMVASTMGSISSVSSRAFVGGTTPRLAGISPRQS